MVVQYNVDKGWPTVYSICRKILTYRLALYYYIILLYYIVQIGKSVGSHIVQTGEKCKLPYCANKKSVGSHIVQTKKVWVAIFCKLGKSVGSYIVHKQAKSMGSHFVQTKKCG